jgi:aminotransferase
MTDFSRYNRSLLVDEYKALGLPSPVQGNHDLHHEVEKRKEDVINLSIMTDQTPPPVVRIAAAEQALKGGYIKNALNVRAKICEFYEKERGVRFDPESEVFLTPGSQLGLDSAFKLLIEPGDEVVLSEPEYATYEPMIHFYGGTAKFVPLVLNKNTWIFDVDAFANAISDKTKLILISNPNNPVGYVYREAELRAIAKLAIKHDCWVLSDEIWSTLVVKEGLDCTSMGKFTDLRDKLVVTFSASKTYGMSGYRSGAIMGPAGFIAAIDQVVRFAAQTAPTIGQVAFARALDLEDTGPWLEQRKSELRSRIRETVGRMNRLKKLRCAEPESGVFLFPNIADYGLSSLQFALKLLEAKGVYVLPGYFYGRHSDGYLRISMAVGERDYNEGMKRFLEFTEAMEN